MLPQDGGDGGVAGDFQVGDGGIAGGGEVVGGVSGAQPATVFVQRHVPHVEAGVLDPPAIADVLDELPGTQTRRRNAGDPVSGGMAGLAMHRHAAFQLEHLLEPRPLNREIFRRGDCQRPCLQATAVFMPGDGLPPPRLAQPLAVGGKSLRDQ